MTMNRILPLLTLALAMLALTSCAEQGYDGPVEKHLYDIVTYTGTPDGGGATFEFRQVDDSPLVTLTSTVRFADEIEPGTRMAICYIPQSGLPYQSGPIDLVGASRINQGAVHTEWADDYDLWDRDSVYVYSAWRSGSYINFDIRLPFSAEPRVLCLAADPATLSDPVPDLYLVHVMATDASQYLRRHYASYSIAPVWEMEHVRGVKVHMANTNLPLHTAVFMK